MSALERKRKRNRDYMRRRRAADPQKAREREQQYRDANRETIRLKARGYSSRYYKANKVKHVAACRRWREANPDKDKARAQRYYQTHKSEAGVSRRRAYKSGTVRLVDWYIRMLLVNNPSNGLVYSKIPQALIAAKRNHLKLKRLLKERTK